MKKFLWTFLSFNLIGLLIVFLPTLFSWSLNISILLFSVISLFLFRICMLFYFIISPNTITSGLCGLILGCGFIFEYIQFFNSVPLLGKVTIIIGILISLPAMITPSLAKIKNADN